MSNAVYVCWDCRVAIKADRDDVLCPHCGGGCACIGRKIAVPAKSKVAEWREMRERFYAERRELALWRQREHVNEVHALEQELARMKAMPDNPGRAVQIKLLEKQLSGAKGRQA